MFALIAEMLSYGFLVRALAAGILISLCAALLGVTLVLKRASMIGDGLAHVGFGALTVAAAMNVAPLIVSVPVVLMCAVLLLRLSEHSAIRGDSAIGLISTSALAIGVLVSSLAGSNVDVNSYMFGSILAMDTADVYLAAGLSATVGILFLILYDQIFAVTFDENFARATGTNVEAYNLVIALLTAVTIVVGMRMMGTLLISSLIIFPALTSMRVFKRFFSVVISSAVVSVVCFLVGMVASYAWSLPTGASVVAANMICFCLFTFIGWKR